METDCPVCRGASKGEQALHWQHVAWLKDLEPGTYTVEFLKGRFRAWELEKRKKAEGK